MVIFAIRFIIEDNESKLTPSGGNPFDFRAISNRAHDLRLPYLGTEKGRVRS